MFEHTYPDSEEDSGRYLRLALKQISRHKLAYTPITYAVWYEYASGRNEDLATALDALESSGASPSMDAIRTLFQTHVANRQIVMAEKKTRQFQGIMADMVRHLAESGMEIDSSGNALTAYADQLSQTDSVEKVSEIARHIVKEARSMAASGHSLKTTMDEKAAEIKTLRRELEGIKKAAKTDMLTGLLNRRGFEDAMEKALASRGDTPETISAVMLDIDHFKRVNDTHGHLIGDNVLKMLARLLRDHVKPHETAARFGGEEFILLLPGTGLEGAFALAEQIRMGLKRMKWMAKNTGTLIGSITVSAGVAQYKPEEPAEKMIERADQALYHAKKTGRNKTVTELDAP